MKPNRFRNSPDPAQDILFRQPGGVVPWFRGRFVSTAAGLTTIDISNNGTRTVRVPTEDTRPVCPAEAEAVAKGYWFSYLP